MPGSEQVEQPKPIHIAGEERDPDTIYGRDNFEQMIEIMGVLVELKKAGLPATVQNIKRILSNRGITFVQSGIISHDIEHFQL